MAVEYYPLDYATLSDGDVISESRIAGILDAKPGTDKFAFGQMELVAAIKREGLSRDKIFTITTERGVGIRILEGADASNHNKKRTREAVSLLVRSHFQNMAVDVTKMTGDEVADHTRELQVEGFYVQALTYAKKQIRQMPHERQTPGKIEHSQPSE